MLQAGSSPFRIEVCHDSTDLHDEHRRCRTHGERRGEKMSERRSLLARMDKERIAQ
jgi:hypothetical protein